MRVAIIAPPYPLEEYPAPPLGVCYVAAAFEKAGAEVRIFDFVVSEYSEKKLKQWMVEFSPHVVGTTSVTMNFNSAAEILCKAKEIMPSVVTMMGGPHVSFFVEGTLNQYPGIDMIVIGEGEQTIAEIAPRISDVQVWGDVPGIAFRDMERIVLTAKREFIQNLDTIPLPARHLLPLSRYRALGFPISIITSRGCPNQCIFCLGRRMVGHKVRYRDIELVLDEVEYLIALGFNRINIADDLFTSNKERVAAFCEGINRRKIKLEWTAFSRVNTIDENTAQIMKDAGCDCISFGIESGNPEMLKRIRKGITLAQAYRAAEICKKSGLIAHASFMVGLPGETMKTLEETKRLAENLDVIYGYHFLAPFPGTTVFEEIDAYDLELLTTDWRRYDANQPVVRSKEVSAEDAKAFVALYMEEIEQAQEKLEKGYEAGTNTPEENLQVEGNRSLGLAFDIISKGLIEKYGGLQEKTAKNTDEAMGLLIYRIADATGRSYERTQYVIRKFYNQGNIQIQNDKNRFGWGWTPNPPFSNYKKWSPSFN